MSSAPEQIGQTAISLAQAKTNLPFAYRLPTIRNQASEGQVVNTNPPLAHIPHHRFGDRLNKNKD